MNEMVTRVAKVLHTALGYEGKWPTPECTQCVDAARRVIEAMREPTDAMCDAPEMRGFAWRNEDEVTAEDVGNAWRAMIDAALDGRA